MVPKAARRRAGFKSGQELEVKASGGVITIVPKVSPDELQDEIASILLRLAGVEQPPAPLTAEEDADLDASMGEAERGEFAPE